ncbi:MAG: hypothetical protein OXC79_02625 [Candidatus Poribacteria bacterium]|nr:hypothetical protein [Candidatus Poribacteria bacterium]
MKISSTFHVLVFLMSLLTFSVPFVTFAQQNSGQTEVSEPIGAQDANAARLETKAAAEQDASNDINKPLWFGIGAGGALLGCTVGAIAGCAVGSMINSEPHPLSSFGVVLPNDEQSVGTLVGGAVGGIGSLIWILNYQSRPPPERLIGKSPEYIEFYTNAYRTKTRSLHKQSAAAGAAITLGCCLLVGLTP